MLNPGPFVAIGGGFIFRHAFFVRPSELADLWLGRFGLFFSAKHLERQLKQVEVHRWQAQLLIALGFRWQRLTMRIERTNHGQAIWELRQMQLQSAKPTQPWCDVIGRWPTVPSF